MRQQIKDYFIYFSKWLLLLLLMLLAVLLPSTLFPLIQHPKMNVGNQMIDISIYFCMACLMIGLAYICFHKFSHHKLIFKLNRYKCKVIISSLLIMIGVQIAFGMINLAIFQQHVTLNQHNFLSGFTSPLAMSVIIFGSIFISPILEELVFRGYVFKSGIVNHDWSKIILSGFLFSLCHGSSNIISFFSYMILGIILAISYLYTKDLKIPILIHMSNNFLAAVMLL